MNNLVQQFSDKMTDILAQQTVPKAICVAVSGGSDSLALTLLLKDFCKAHTITLFAVTIDHKMRETSQEEAIALGKLLKHHTISHTIIPINKEDVPQSNIEAKLREIRYEKLHDFCVEKNAPFLFLGHIQGDIAENFIIRLFRGSGLDGLSSIAQSSQFGEIQLMRPLLDITKDALKSFLIEKNIQWFEDETNNDEKFLRNKVRHFFDSFEDKDLIHKRVKAATDDISKMRDLFDGLMLQQASDILALHDNRFIVLDVQKFTLIKERIALKMLALTLMEIGNKPYKPRLEKLKRFYDWVIETDNRKARNFYGCMAKPFEEEKIAIYNEADAEQEIVTWHTLLKEILT